MGVQESSSIGSTSEVTSLGVLMTTPSLTGSLDSAFSSVGVLMRPDSADRFGWTSMGERHGRSEMVRFVLRGATAWAYEDWRNSSNGSLYPFSLHPADRAGYSLSKLLGKTNIWAGGSFCLSLCRKFNDFGPRVFRYFLGTLKWPSREEGCEGGGEGSEGEGFKHGGGEGIKHGGGEGEGQLNDRFSSCDFCLRL